MGVPPSRTRQVWSVAQRDSGGSGRPPDSKIPQTAPRAGAGGRGRRGPSRLPHQRGPLPGPGRPVWVGNSASFAQVSGMLRAPQVTAWPLPPEDEEQRKAAASVTVGPGRQGPHSPFPSAAPWCARPARRRPLYSRPQPCWLSAARDKRFAGRRVSAGPAP